ncbi:MULTISPECIES: aspartate/glutamate racemase family protein [unclassified Paracoccus (in: a-proteobacteria)]|uniref:aspartate/glutamate racemase family protein n=1 Tax=unclassified Paracoccus (in: a-proteobacteria) TaxID=2688777 RepID=UPI0012B2877B|nr:MULTISPECIES: aspartate/glutamate racemase family protein [unclassified Paracoccus (in: a-proteobacteria)]UXU76328.1 aspartate/glutamate racemase family protein [Paracoccus sp. SMMA_5]UXU82334.1 aspartate/glutamate racemase family protein [Paracoccus sp. SMMA_5_TC]
MALISRARALAMAAGCSLALLSGQGVARDAVPIIVLINPNSNEEATRAMTELAQAAVGDAALVQGHSNAGAPALLTTPQDMADAIPGVVRIGTEVSADPRVKALIVSAFSDPGLPELRAAVRIPVLGIGEEVFHEAARNGRPFGIVTVTPDEKLVASFRDKAESLGYGAQYRGVRVTPGDPKLLVRDPALLDAALAEAARQSITRDGAQAVIMGGGPLSASAIRLQPQFDQPLVVAVTAAARAALAKLAPENPQH